MDTFIIKYDKDKMVVTHQTGVVQELTLQDFKVLRDSFITDKENQEANIKLIDNYILEIQKSITPI